MIRSAVFALIVVALPWVAAARDFLPDPEIEAGAASYSHRYANCQHGFSLDIPQGLTGYDENGPMGMSGVAIILSHGAERALLTADAVSNAEIGMQSIDEAASAISKLSCKQRGGNILSEGHTNVKLGDQAARRVVLECRSEGRLVIDDTVTLFHAQRQTVYMVGLRVDRGAYAKYLPQLEALLKSWQLGEPGCK